LGIELYQSTVEYSPPFYNIFKNPSFFQFSAPLKYRDGSHFLNQNRPF